MSRTGLALRPRHRLSIGMELKFEATIHSCAISAMSGHVRLRRGRSAPCFVRRAVRHACGMNLEGIVSKRIGSGYVQRPDAGMAEDEPKTIGENGRSRRRGVGDIACFPPGPRPILSCG